MTLKTLLLASLASLFVASAAWAVPSQLAHQGRLLDTEGVALAGEHALTFALFDAETEGNEVWSETITVNIVGGFYSVVLGADEGANPLDDMVLSNPPLWLELSVDDGEPLLPRHELLSVPYAVLAGTATNVEGGYVDASEVAVDGTTVIDASGNWVGPTPAVDWTDLSGVPSGLLDGQDADTLAALSCADEGIARYDLGSGLWVCGADAVLTPSDVLGFVDGATLAVGAGSTMNGSTLATLADLTWSSLTGVPLDLADGDADTLAGLSCANGDVAKFNLGTGLWDCGTDLVLSSTEVLGFVDGTTLDFGVGSTVNGVTIATVADLDWSVLTSVPVGFLDGDDADTLAVLGPTCAEGDRAAWDSTLTAWVCAPEEVGLERLDTSAAAGGQVLTFDGTSVGWEDPTTTTNPPCTLTAINETAGGALLDCGGAPLRLHVRAEFMQLSRGASHSCGITSGGITICWGSSTNGQTTPPPNATFTQLSVGASHTCGVESSGAVQCWGADNYGESSPPAGSFTQVDAGNLHTCGVDSAGAVQCWGYDYYGESTPPSGTFSQVSAGQNHTCGVDGTGSIQCWGYDNYGQSSPPAGSFTQVTAGASHTCAINAGGSIECWGVDDGSIIDYGQVTSPPGGAFTQVSAGEYHNCGIDSTGSAQCWGQNNFGQSSPLAGTFTQVSAGDQETCGILQTIGTVTCWGRGSSTP